MHAGVKAGKGGSTIAILYSRKSSSITTGSPMKVEKTKTGVKVTESSDDPYVTKLIAGPREGGQQVHRQRPRGGAEEPQREEGGGAMQSVPKEPRSP